MQLGLRIAPVPIDATKMILLTCERFSEVQVAKQVTSAAPNVSPDGITIAALFLRLTRMDVASTQHRRKLKSTRKRSNRD